MPSVNEEYLDRLTERTFTVLRAAASSRREHVKMLEAMQAEIAALVVAADFGTRAATQRKRLNDLLDAVTGKITQTYRAMSALNTRHLVQVAKAEAVFITQTTNELIGREIAKGLSEDVVQALAKDATVEGMPTKDWWSKQAGDTRFRYHGTIRKGVEQGLHPRDIVKEVQEVVTPATKRNAEALVRTSFASVAQEARMETWQADDDLIKGWQWHATLDNRTTLICMSLDGLRWDKDGTPIGHNKRFQRPPAHFSCRSDLLPLYKSARELGYDIDDIEEDQEGKWSMDGNVPTSTTFTAFLNKKGAKFQDKLLGPSRAKLFREGKLSLSDLTNVDGRPLRLDEL